MKHKRRKTLDETSEIFFWWMLIGIGIALAFIVADHYFIKFVVIS